jgi:hypothetical protein
MRLSSPRLRARRPSCLPSLISYLESETSTWEPEMEDLTFASMFDERVIEIIPPRAFTGGGYVAMPLLWTAFADGRRRLWHLRSVPRSIKGPSGPVWVLRIGFFSLAIMDCSFPS